MTSLTSNEPASVAAPIAGGTPPAWAVQIVQPGGADRTIHLPTGKCTIGSSQRCQIHLLSSQVRPLHCLIVHGASETVVTRWAPGVRLNGQDFSTSPLKPGDSLQIADVQLRIVADANEQPAPSAEPTWTQPTPPASPPRPTPPESSIAAKPSASTPAIGASALDQLDRLLGQLTEAKTSARHRCRKLVAALRELRAQAGNYDQQIGSLQSQLGAALVGRDESAARLQEVQTEAVLREEQATDEMDRLITELTTSYEKAGETETAIREHLTQRAALQNEIDTLNQQREQLEQARAAGESQRSKLAQALSDRQLTIDQLHRDLAESRDANGSANAETAKQAARCEQLQAEFNRLQSEYDLLVAAQNESAERLGQIEQDLAERDRRIEALATEVSTSQAASDATAEQLAQQSAQCQRLQSELDQLRNEHQRLTVSEVAWAERRREIEQTVTEREQCIEGLTAELEQSKQAGGSTSEQLTHQTAERERLQGELDQLRHDHEQLIAAEAASAEHRREIEQTVAEREQCIEGLTAKLEQWKQSGDATAEELAQQAERNEQLEAELGELQSEHQQFVEKHSDLVEQQEQIQASADERDGRIQDLTAELEQTQAAGELTNQQLAQQILNGDQLRAEIQQLEFERELLASTRTDHQLRHQETAQAVADRDRRVEQLRAELEEQRRSTELAEQQAAEQTAKSQQLEQQLNQLQAEHDQLVAAHTDHSDNHREWEQTLADRDRQLAEAREEYDQICGALHTVEEGAFEQVDKCLRLEAEMVDLRTAHEEWTKTKDEREDRIRQLEQIADGHDSQVTALKDQLASLTQSRTELENELAERSQACHDLEAELTDLRDRCQQLSAEHLSSEQQQLELQQMFGEYEQRIEQLSSELQIANQQRHDLEQTAAERTASCEELQTELADVRHQYSAAVEEQSTESGRRKELDTELAEQRQRVELFEIDLKSLRAELSYSNDQIARLVAERSELEERLSSLRADLDAKERHLAEQGNGDEQLRDERDELVADLKATQQRLQDTAEQLEATTQQLQSRNQEFEDLEHRATDDLANASETTELLSRLEAEKSSLTAQVDKHVAHAEQVANKLEEKNNQLAEGQNKLEQLDQLYQQTRGELQQARESLLLAEQALQNRSANAELPAVDQPRTEVDSGVSSGDPSTSAAKAAEEYEAAIADDPSPVDDSTDEPAATEEVANDAPTSSGRGADPRCTVNFFSAQEGQKTSDDSESAEEFQPTSFIEQYSHLLDDADSSGATAAEPVAAAPTEASAGSPQNSELGDEADAVALESYMSNMLCRMRGDSNTDVAPPLIRDENHKLHADPVGTVNAMTERVVAASETPLTAEVMEPLDLEQLRNTSKKPELSVDLAAMRALANSSARSAIAKHHKRRHLEGAAGSLVVCLIATVVGVYMLLTSEPFSDWKFFGGCAAALIGFFGALKLLKLLLLAIREGSWSADAPAEIPVDDEPLPIDVAAEAVGASTADN